MPACRDLTEFFQNPNGFDTLGLYCQNLRDDQVILLAKALETNTSLTALSLWGNHTKEKGGIALGLALRTNKSLEKLDLWNNQLGPQGAKGIAHGLKSNSSLKKLNLKGNSIGDEGAKWIAESIVSNCTLTELTLSENSITEKGANDIATSLENNSTLLKLQLYESDQEVIDSKSSVATRAKITKLLEYNSNPKGPRPYLQSRAKQNEEEMQRLKRIRFEDIKLLGKESTEKFFRVNGINEKSLALLLKHEVDGSVLFDLCEDEFRSMGMNLIERKQIINILDKYKMDNPEYHREEEDWDVEKVGLWLLKNNFSQDQIDLMQRGGINGIVLLHLGRSDLGEIGIPVKERKEIISKVASIRMKVPMNASEILKLKRMEEAEKLMKKEALERDERIAQLRKDEAKRRASESSPSGVGLVDFPSRGSSHYIPTVKYTSGMENFDL